MDDFLNEDTNQDQVEQTNDFGDSDDFGYENNNNAEQSFDDDDNFGENQQQEEQQEGGFDDDFSSSSQQQQQQQEEEEEEEQVEEEPAQQEETAFSYEEPVQTKTSPLQEWRVQKQKQVDEADEAARKKQQEIRTAAAEYKKKFIKTREEKKDNKHKKNVEEEEIFVQTNQVNHDNVWENVLKYVDIHGTSKKTTAKKEEDLEDLDKVDLSFKKSKDVTTEAEVSAITSDSKDTSRMRKILLTLKNQPLAESA